MMMIVDDDVPKVPDPAVDDLWSGQARRAVEHQLELVWQQTEQLPLPVVIHS